MPDKRIIQPAGAERVDEAAVATELTNVDQEMSRVGRDLAVATELTNVDQEMSRVGRDLAVATELTNVDQEMSRVGGDLAKIDAQVAKKSPKTN